jgi:hypothetical protein
MPSRRDIELELSSHDLSHCRALKSDEQVFRLAGSFLEDFGFILLARHLEKKVAQGKWSLDHSPASWQRAWSATAAS